MRRNRQATLIAALLLGTCSCITYADRATHYTYNTLGLVATIDGPRTDVKDITTYKYDTKGNRTHTTNALGHVTKITAHDASGRPLTLVDPNGVTTKLAYDPRGRLITRTTKGRMTSFTYDGVGNLTRLTQPDNSFIGYTYDAAHRLIGITDTLGNRIDYTLDAAGNRTKETVEDATGQLTRIHTQVYDELSRLIKDTGAAKQTSGYSYDANGNQTGQIDANLNTTVQAYDALNRPKQVTDALNGVTQYTYDKQGDITGITDPSKLTTTYEYDGLGNLVSQTSPDTGITTYTYDEAGNRLTKTDARGITVTYTYDALNRLTSNHYPDTSLNVSFGYDQGKNGIGRLTCMTDANGVTEYNYDAFGHLLSQSRASGSSTTRFQYGYDNAGRLTSLTYPSGNKILYRYNAQGQVKNLRLVKPDGTTQPLATHIQRLPFGPIKVLKYGSGLNLSRSFDQDYQLTAQEIPGILQGGYSHDPVGNIIDWKDRLDKGQDQQFSYDRLDRLTGASGAYGQLGYDYDATGNRLSLSDENKTTTYDYALDSHHLQQILGTVSDTRSYDAAGNTLESLAGDFVYDDTNRLVRFSNADTLAEYAFNGKGERISKTVNGITTRFRYSPEGQLLGEYDETGQPIREYVYLDGQPLALLTTTKGAEATVLQAVSSKHRWHTADLGSHVAKPIIIAGPPTTNGTQAAVVSLRNITKTNAQVAIKEWNYLDGRHAREAISLLSLPPGQYPQADGSLWEVGRFNLKGTRQWQTVSFNQAYTSRPYLFLTQQTVNGNDVTTVRARNVTNSGFEAALYEQERFQNGHTSEAIGYLAIYSPTGSGTAKLKGVTLRYQLNQMKLDEKWASVGNQKLKYQEEQSLDRETGHLFETMDVLQLQGHTFVQDVSSAGRDSASVRRKGATPGKALTGGSKSHSVAYLHTDHLDAVVKATGEGQSLLWDAQRRPFGERSLLTSSIEMPLGLPGQYFDGESGLYYNYFRTYDPSTGRYLESDPIGLQGGLNTYAYVGNNPLSIIDPLGLSWKSRKNNIDNFGDLLDSTLCDWWPAHCLFKCVRWRCTKEGECGVEVFYIGDGSSYMSLPGYDPNDDKDCVCVREVLRGKD